MKKALFVSLLIFGMSHFISAQEWQFLKQWVSPNTGGTSSEITAIDSKSNSTGTKFYHLGRKNNGSDNDLVLACVNATGGTDWEISYNSGSEDLPVSLAIDNSGNLYCFLNSSVSGIMKGRIIKYNSSGAVQWNNTYGGLAGLTINHGAIDASGNIYYTGYFMQTSTLGNISTAKINSAGTTLWTMNNNASGYLDAGRYVAIDGTGNVYVAGYTHPTTGASTDWRMLKYSSAGTQLFAYSANYNSIDTATIIAFDGANNVFFAGVGSNGIDYNVYYRKYNSAGSLVYGSPSLGISAADNRVQMVCDPLNNVMVAFAKANNNDNYITVSKYTSGNVQSWSTDVEPLFSASTGNGFKNRPKALLVDSDSSWLYLGSQGGAVFSSGYYNKGFVVTRLDLSTGTYHYSYDRASHSSYTYSVSTSENVTGMFFTDNKHGIVLAGGHKDPNTGINKFKTVKWNCYAPIVIAHTPSFITSINSSNVYSCGNDPHLISVPDSIQLQPSGILSGYSYYWIASNSPSMTLEQYLLNPTNYETNTAFIVNRNDPYTFFKVPSGTNPKYRMLVTDSNGNQFLSFQVSIGTAQSSPSDFNLIADGPLSFCPGDSVNLSWSSVSTSYSFGQFNDLANSTTIYKTGSYTGTTNPQSMEQTYYSSGTIFAQIDKTFPTSGNEYSGYDYLGSFPGCIYVSDTLTISAVGLTVDLGPDLQVCSGQSVSLDAGSGYSGYSWNTGATSQSIAPTTSGLYSVTVTNGSGCTAYDEINVTVLPLPTVSAGADQAICAGNSANINASGAVSYSWDNSIGSGAAQIVSPASTTTYTVTGTDANGCQNTDAILITVHALPSVLTSPDVSICEGSSTNLSASGAQTYIWTPGSSNGSTISVTPSASTTYTVTGTDANGCQNTDQVLVTVNPNPGLSTNSTPASCGNSNGTAEVLVNSGQSPFTYSWTNGATTASISNISAGTYTVTVSDANNCSSQTNALVSNIGGPVAQIQTSGLNCADDADGIITSSISGGTSPYTYLWSTGATTTSISNLSPGMYSLQVTDANGCIENQSVNFTALHTNPAVAIIGNTSYCMNSAIQLQAQGANSYTWSTGGTTEFENLTITSPLTITVTGTDLNGCTGTDQLGIGVNPLPVANEQTTNANCNQSDGTAQVNPTNGSSPYSVLWSTGETTNAISNLSAGNYSVSITDANNCTSNTTIIIDNAGAPVVDLYADVLLCHNDTNGSANATITGGNPPYQLLWSNGETTNAIQNLAAGTYSITVTDAMGCITLSSANVSYSFENPVLDLGQDTTICSGDQIALTGTSGMSSYLWTTGETSPSTMVNASGNYGLTITDNNGCSAADTILVSVVNCAGISEQEIKIVVYPNPASTFVQVDASEKIISYTLYETTGKRIKTQIINSDQVHIDLEKEACGSYILEMTTSSGIIQQMIVKQ